MPGDWFVVHTYSGMENRVKSNLENHHLPQHGGLHPRDRGPHRGGRGDQERSAQDGQAHRPPRLRPGPHGPHRRVLVGRAAHAVGHRLRRPQPPAGAAEHERGREHARPRRGRAGRGRGRRRGVRRRPPPPRAPPPSAPSRSPTSTSPTRSWSSTARSPRCTRRSPRSTPSRSGSRPFVEIFGRETPRRAVLLADSASLRRVRGPVPSLRGTGQPRRSSSADADPSAARDCAARLETPDSALASTSGPIRQQTTSEPHNRSVAQQQAGGRGRRTTTSS